ncbi:hypothetical protein Tco_0242792 [Tanacetum coccineum]
MKDEDGFFFFKFASISGVEQVLEQRPWLIRNTPLILQKWTPNMSFTKDKVTKVPVWVKMHRVPTVAYSEDGLSLIGSQIGKLIMDMWVNIHSFLFVPSLFLFSLSIFILHNLLW